MNEYFFLAEKVKPGTAFACTEGDTPLSYELIPDLITRTELPFALTLKRVISVRRRVQISNDISEAKQLWVDYQPNNLAWPLMSEKMKTLVSAHLTGKEGIAWIKAEIKAPDERREYFIPCFQRRLDVLDEQRTTYVAVTSHIVKPVFSRRKIINYSLFFVPQEFWQIPSGLYVNEALKRAMEKEKLTGLDFEEISVAQ